MIIFRSSLGRVIVLGLTLGLFPPMAYSAHEFRAGFSTVTITPPVGWRKGGGFSEIVSTGTRDPLLAKTLVFQHGSQVAVLVICDLLSVTEPLTTDVRREVQKRLGIPREAIVICATHTHGGPEYHGPLRDLYHNRAVATKGKDPHEPIDYVAFLSERLVEGIDKALRSTLPMRLEVVRARQEGMAFNRRFYMKNGLVRFNPGKGNPDIERPAGPTDPDLPFLLIRRASDNVPVAGLSVFAMHVATFGGTEWGADYPAYVAKRLTRHFGENFFSLFGQGAAGDINHVNTATREADPTFEQIGTRLGDTLISHLKEAVPVPTPLLSVRSAVVPGRLLEVTPEQVARAHEVMARTGIKPIDFLLHVEAWRVLHNDVFRRRFGNTMPNELQVIQLGPDLALVLLPHEIFVEIGLDIKKRSPFKDTLVVSMAHDVDFYVPTRRAYAEGGYEVVTTPLYPGIGEALADEAVRLLQGLKK